MILTNRITGTRSLLAMMVALTIQLLSTSPVSAQKIQTDSTDPTCSFAAKELKRYLDEMGVRSEATQFFIGNIPQNEELLRSIEKQPNATDETFQIFTDQSQKKVHLVGASSRSSLYAVYAYLEKQGCRFFAPGPLGEVIPTRKDLQWFDKTIIESPKMHTREIGGSAPPNVTAAAAVDWRVKNRLNRAFALRPGRFPVGQKRNEMRSVWKNRGQYRHWQWICHNFPFIFPEEENWFEKHPEYFALYQGKRRRPGSSGRAYYGGGNLAFTNSEVIEHTAKFAESWFKRFPQGEVVPVWPNDGAIYWDESPKAMKLGGRNFTTGPSGSMTARMVHFANSVARKIAKKTKKNQLILLPAYANYIQPIQNQKIEDNILVQYCYHGDYAHGPEQVYTNQKSAKQMRTWASQAKHFGVWEYFLIGDFQQTDPAPILLPLVYRIRDTMKFLHEIGCRHYFTQSTPAYQTYNPLVYYALARYTWDPDLDADKLIVDYCEHSFGRQAGIPMTKFYQSMEEACQKSDWSPTTYGEVVSPSPSVFSKSLLLKLQKLLDQAFLCQTTASQKARLNAVKEALRATGGAVKVARVVDLSGKGGWRMIRTDESYLINPDGPIVDRRKFEAIVQHAVDTGGGGPALNRIAFRARRRLEKIIKLRSNELSLAIVPGLGGRAVRFIDKTDGWNFFHEGPAIQKENSVSKSYIEYGGYETYAGKQFAAPGWEQEYSVIDRSDSLLKLKTSGEGWSQQRTYQLDQSTEKLTIREKLAHTAADPEKRAIRIHPQLTLGGDPRKIVLFRRPAGGHWAKVDVLKNLHDQIFPSFSDTNNTNEPIDEIAVWQPETHRGLLIRTISPSIDSMPKLYVFADKGKKHFQIERLGVEKNLKTNQSISLRQEYEPFRHPKEVGLENLVSSNSTAKPVEKNSVTGKVSKWIEGNPGKGSAAIFDANHRLSFPNHRISAAKGTLAAWVKIPPATKKPYFVLSSGNNSDGWLALTISSDSASWLCKIGKPPFTGPGEGYSSLAAKWSDVKTPAKSSIQNWRHLAYSWQLNDDKKTCELTIRIDGKVAQKRSNLAWVGGMPQFPLIIGGNSASKNSAGEVSLDNLIYLNHPIDSDQEMKKVMDSPKSVAGRIWFFSFDKTIQPMAGKE